VIHKIIGTAGHIDHGKSSLVRALTGTDPDRLAEEQERGMTIDLGFAFLNENIAIIDVPGHEKFIRNMVAGVSTIDLALLVIAADDGIMPQTREHFDILKLLQLRHGIIALTKIDIVEKEWLEIVHEDIRSWIRGSFLEAAPIVPVSSQTSEGIAELRRLLITKAEETPSRNDRGIFWMPVDRSFTIKGHGTVVTGSVLSGEIHDGDSIELLPAQQTLRLRGIQTHGRTTARAQLGDRAALNVMNVSKNDIHRGDVLATPGSVEPSSRIDVKLSTLPSAAHPLAGRTRLRLHLGTREVMARVRLLDRDKLPAGASCYAQLILEEPVVALKREPFIIRFYSPQFTIGGGIILDAHPPLHRRHDRDILEHLKRLEDLNPVEIVISALVAIDKPPIKLIDLAKELGLTPMALEAIVQELVSQKIIYLRGNLLLHRQNFHRLKVKIIESLGLFHTKEPLRPGMIKSALSLQVKTGLPFFEATLEELTAEQLIAQQDDVIRLADFAIHLNPAEEKQAEKIMAILAGSPFLTPPPKIIAQMSGLSNDEIQHTLTALQGMGRIVRLDEDIYFTTAALAEVEKKLEQFAPEDSEFGVGEFRELLNTTRKFALPLLNYFDEKGITERIGEKRRISQKKRPV